MDADFSHHPKYIPNLISLSGKGIFVIGSRFCDGGSSASKGLRKYTSIFRKQVYVFYVKLSIKRSYNLF